MMQFKYKVAMLCKPFHFQYCSVKVDGRIIYDKSDKSDINFHHISIFSTNRITGLLQQACQGQHKTLVLFIALKLGNPMEIKCFRYIKKNNMDND
ncbi:uncharacterized protein LOC119649784 isoform X2 [Hermetia illucens]|uniref:uncharacterized protein LOC119649784 isoform X2 n=1 Tax=Hermetia illucens TaxID=343691 RepID=UPI0018CC3FF1|nr:uncharacterized protein LOC119649784 isoform X2 [Hermetia illucens]